MAQFAYKNQDHPATDYSPFFGKFRQHPKTNSSPTISRNNEVADKFSMEILKFHQEFKFKLSKTIKNKKLRRIKNVKILKL